MTESLPYFTVGLTCCDVMGNFGSLQHHSLPSEFQIMNLLSSDQITLRQSSIVQCLYFLANLRLAILCRCFRRGFFFFSLAIRLCLLNSCLILLEEFILFSSFTCF